MEVTALEPRRQQLLPFALFFQPSPAQNVRPGKEARAEFGIRAAAASFFFFKSFTFCAWKDATGLLALHPQAESHAPHAQMGAYISHN